MNPDPLPPLAPLPSPGAGPATPPPAVAQVRRRGGPGWLTLLVAVAALFAVGGLAFAAGRVTAPVVAASTGAGNGFGSGNGAFRGNGFAAGNGTGNGLGAALGAAGGGLTLRGTVTAVAADHVTLQLAGGQTIDIPTSSSTTYHRATGASAKDVTTGASVEVTLSGRFGRGAGGGGNGGPNASGAPAASPGAGGLASRMGPATDITVTGG